MNTHSPASLTLCTFILLGLAPGCDKVEALLGNEPQSSEKDEAASGPAEPVAEPPKTAAAEPPKTEGESPAPEAAEPSPSEASPAEPTDEAEEPEANAEPAADDAAEAEPTAEASVAAGGTQPCIVGRWKATEYLAEVRRAIAKEPTLSGLKKSSSGGLFGYEVGPVEGGKGMVAAKAESLRYVFKGKVQGFPVTLTFTLDGEAEADYTLVGNDTIIVDKPKKKTLVARANAKVEGLGKHAKSPRVDHEFDGTFNYTCTDEKLEVWRLGGRKDITTFERESP
jgi:hypothetical protein